MFANFMRPRPAHLSPVAAVAALGLTLGTAAPALALQVDGTTIIPDSGDTGWLMAALILGLLAAIPGLLLYLIGHNGWSTAQRTLTSVIAALAMTTLLYIIIGYSLMFDVSDGLGGGHNWMLNAMGTVREGTTVPETGFVAFQLGFVFLAVALLVGALAPRARPGWLLAFTGLWFLFVLVPVTRWIWGGGWLADMGALDMAGGLTVFYCAGVSALVALVLIGARANQTGSEPSPLTQLGGALLLCVGMLALTAGATLGASDDAGVAALTLFASSMTALLVSAALYRSLDAAALAKGLIAGTVAIAAAGDSVSVGGAILIGALAATAMWITPRLMPKRFAWQDRGGAIAGITGAAKTGAFLLAFFLSFDMFGGSGYGDDMTMGGQTIAQLTAILAIAGWSVAGTLIAALSAGMILPMRLDAAHVAVDDAQE